MLMTLYLNPCFHPLIIIVLLKDVRRNLNCNLPFRIRFNYLGTKKCRFGLVASALSPRRRRSRRRRNYHELPCRQRKVATKIVCNSAAAAANRLEPTAVTVTQLSHVPLTSTPGLSHKTAAAAAATTSAPASNIVFLVAAVAPRDRLPVLVHVENLSLSVWRTQRRRDARFEFALHDFSTDRARVAGTEMCFRFVCCRER